MSATAGGSNTNIERKADAIVFIDIRDLDLLGFRTYGSHCAASAEFQASVFTFRQAQRSDKQPV